jgi:cell division protein FtsL
MVCSKAAMHLTVNTEVMTLQQLVDKASAAAAVVAFACCILHMYMCSRAAMHLTVNTEVMTLQQLVDKVSAPAAAVWLLLPGG